MNSKLKLLKKRLRLLKNPAHFKAKLYYTSYYEKKKINKNVVLIQSYGGSSLSGSPYYMLLEMCKNENYAYLKKYVAATEKDYLDIKNFLINKGLMDVKVVKIHSNKYCKLLATAEYLLNNATFPPYFIKKKGQKYFNTWHGTPLKALGRSIIDAPNEIGNTQRNFIMADYLLYPNEFTFEHMKKDYMLDNFFKGKYVVSGYPRNEIFFNKKQGDEIREELGISDKKIAVYMPTWRGNLKNKKTNKQTVYILHTLYEIDDKLTDDTILYVKFHSLTNIKIDYKEFKHIRKFPDNYETYEFLNVADCLVTDYSSVFFDFANTKRKVILYGYDKEEYLSDKGMYLDYDALPFTFVQAPIELASELNVMEEYESYSQINKYYTKYDSIHASKEMCELFFYGKKSSNMKLIDGKKFNSNKPNVLVFTGALMKNGITTALKSLFSELDNNRYNFVLTFFAGTVEPNKHVIREFDRFDYIPIQGRTNFKFFELIFFVLYFYFRMHGPFIEMILKKIYEREIKRNYPGISFDYAIHFSGYEARITKMIQHMDAKKMIYIHNDMKKVDTIRKNLNSVAFKSALKKYDNIVCIRETSREEIIDYYPSVKKGKLKVAHNLNNIKEIMTKSKEGLVFDKDTYCNIDLESLNNILSDNKNEIITTIGRFSIEKGHKRLINAFMEYSKNKDNSYLIVVGGYGPDFNDERQFVESLKTNKVIIIKSLINPYPILNRTNLFVLSSFYEGLPIVIMEALILGKTVISTNIPGPSEFLKQGYGHLVDNSEEGILQGLHDFNDKKLGKLKTFNAQKFNEKAIKEFYDLFK